MIEDRLSALALWVGAHLILTLVLALNVTRHRLNAGKDEYTPERLERAIRAHGNNIEYVPFVLLGIVVLYFCGLAALWIHALCGLLLVARLCHAHGIQQEGPLPKTRVIGNVGTWLVMLLVGLRLIARAFGL
ncbi:MAG: MAPEG family protein [Pseudomonadota bacterium]